MAGSEEKSARMSMILPGNAHARVRALAAADDVSAAWMIRAAILRFLDEHSGQTELPLRLLKLRRVAV